MLGRIVKIVHSHGFGFIQSDDGQQVFFHRADLLELDFHRLREGLSVEFYLPRKAGEDIQRAVIVRPSRQEAKKMLESTRRQAAGHS